MIETITAIALLQAAPIQAVPDEPAPPAASPSRPSCDSEAHGAFDFWVGEWDVFLRGSDRQVGTSRIERLYAGCAVRENWMPANGADGGSLNSLDPVTGRWHQTWIGSTPGRVEFEGGPVEGGMVLSGLWRGIGGPGRDGLVRMTYTPAADGSVRQHGQVSYDHGLTWADSFDFDYRPRAETTPLSEVIDQ